MAGLKYSNEPHQFKNCDNGTVAVRKVKNSDDFLAFLYKCPLNVDWDGAPDAYGLDRPGMPGQSGLDPWESPAHRGSLSNARTHANWSEHWCGIYTATRGEAIEILQQNGLIPPSPKGHPHVLSAASHDILRRFWDNRATTPFGHSLEDLSGNGRFPIVQIPEMQTTIEAGYYVSKTAWEDESKEEWDPHRYLDASAVPYSVIPALHGVGLGDYGLIIRNKTGASTPYVCADISADSAGSHTLGECSGAVYLALGEVKTGDFSFIVFPHSRNGSDITDTNAAESAVRFCLRKLSEDDADDLARHLSSHMMERFPIRTALAQWGAPPIPPIDAISGAGAAVGAHR